MNVATRLWYLRQYGRCARTWEDHLADRSSSRESHTAQPRGWLCGTLERERLDERGTYTVSVRFVTETKRVGWKHVPCVDGVQCRTKRGTWRRIVIDFDEETALLAGDDE